MSGSPKLLANRDIHAIATTKSCTPAQVVFRIAQVNGVTPLSGTTQEKHMDDAVATEKLDLTDVHSFVDGVLTVIRT